VRTRIWAGSAIASPVAGANGAKPGRHARDAARSAYLPAGVLAGVGVAIALAVAALPDLRATAAGAAASLTAATVAVAVAGV
jgi:hypothetical protein